MSRLDRYYTRHRKTDLVNYLAKYYQRSRIDFNKRPVKQLHCIYRRIIEIQFNEREV